MDRPPVCFNAWNRLMPTLRAETARRLVKSGMPQDRIAEHLGVSQAMVSKYLRRRPSEAPPRLLTPAVERSVQLAVEDEARGRVSAWCPVCVSLGGAKGSAGTLMMPGLQECLRHEASGEDPDAQRVLTQLADAETRLRRLRLGPLMPQVRPNLAMCTPDARNTRDVASFPGRFVEIHNTVQAAAAPAFGSSSHLAHVLLRLRRHQPHARAIFNARYAPDVRKAVRAAGLKMIELQRSKKDLILSVPATPRLDAVADPGAFGVEPALYLLGDSAADVVQKLTQVLAHIRSEEAA